jgi:phenylpropionate dioxygenase-like ring-hydroxylating dioxygenase large terminal subunit
MPLEQAHIFTQTWLYAGDSAHLSVGQVWVKRIAGHPLVITCVAPGQFQAFHNVCPHRAAELCPTLGIHTQKHLVCPYHAWVYSLDGTLVGTPAREQFTAAFNPQAYGLKSVRIESWSGFLFVCLGETAPPLEEFLGSIPRQLGQHRTPTTRMLLTQSRQVACNWKNYHDNTLCDYHVAIAHRHTLHRVQGPVKLYQHQLEPYVNLLYTPVPQSWQVTHPIRPDLPELSRQGFLTYGIFPNLHLLGLPNGLLAWIQIDPLTVETCQVSLEIFGDPALSPPGATLKADFEAFMAEDMALTESVQRGYASGAYQPGPVNGLEVRIAHQQHLILAALNEGLFSPAPL